MLRKFFILIYLAFHAISGIAQFNTDRLLVGGRIALRYEDYVLSIQYFSQIIQLKPFMYEPWQLRGVAKFYLDDVGGAEADATEALKLNPYIPEIYDLRGMSRIRQKKYSEAIEDYTNALKISPGNRNFLYNRAICYVEDKEYDIAELQLDTIMQKWSNFAAAYNLRAELCILQKDTTQAAEWLDKSLEIDPYNAAAWNTRANISLSRKQWKEADEHLSKYLRLRPRAVSSYINRALARVNTNNLRGAMADYDTALDIDPQNFLAHYNRALLRLQVGDDNRAIEDFDYVLKMEPDNIMALYNRAMLNDITGNLQQAISDYSRIIKQFPNFWTGLLRRASCYRRLGMTAKAELDEFKVYKAQMDKHIGIQPRWSRAKLREVRKRSDIDLDKYGQMVIADEAEDEHEYMSGYRGKVQNHSVEVDFLPEHPITGYNPNNGQSRLQNYADAMTSVNTQKPITQELSIDSLTIEISHNPDVAELRYTRGTLLARQSRYEEAINDFTECLILDPQMPEAYFNRGLCYIFSEERDKGLRDLSKAGELGLYSAYSLMKKFAKDD